MLRIEFRKKSCSIIAGLREVLVVVVVLLSIARFMLLRAVEPLIRGGMLVLISDERSRL